MFGSIKLNNTNPNTWDVFIAKYDATGNVLWAKSAGGISFDEGNSVSADANGNVLVTGAFFNPTITFGSITLTNTGGYHQNVFIVKYDASGNVLWAKCTAATADAVGYSVITDPDGNVFVTGRGAMLSFDSITLANTGMFVAKYDVNGNILWAKRATGTGVSYNRGYSISSDEDGNVFVTGSFSSSAITLDSITLFLPLGSNNAMFIVKYDANGDAICASVLPASGDGVSADRFGNAYIGGGFAVNPFIIGADTLLPTSTSYYRSNVFVAKYNSNISVTVNELNNQESISVFPNPSSGNFTINPGNKTAETEIYIYDLLGNCILNKSINNNLEIDLSFQPKGIYFMEIVSGRKRQVKKLILQ